MSINIEETRSTLNGLIETLKDGQEGFRNAAEKLENQATADRFRTYSQQRSAFAGGLQAEVTRLGAEPATSGSLGGSIHRGWIDLKAALTGNSDLAILEEAERGEDAAVKNYHDALSKQLPGDIRAIVETQYYEILNTHNIVRNLRDSAKPTTFASGGGVTAY